MNDCDSKSDSDSRGPGCGGKELTVKGQKETGFGNKIFSTATAMMLRGLCSTSLKTHQIVLLNCKNLTNVNFTSIKPAPEKIG